MIRKLSLAVAVATALSPVGALALGLGEIHPQSALNQAFKADIDLLSVSQEELQDVRVSLASREAFEKAGMERPFLLTGLQFAPMLTPAGKPVISISSKDAIREPFLNFLIEVNWPKGRLVREYTVLLDPPVTLKRAPQAVTAPATSIAPTPSPAQLGRSRPAAVTSSMSSETGGREYGPVEPNDNLWTIAKGMQRADESVEQVMMALQRHNPSAFINNNVNNLKVGKILRLPEDAAVTSLTKQEARDEFLAQTRSWKTGRGEAAAPSTAKKPVSTETQEEDRLRLISAKPGEGEAAEREGMAESDSEVRRLQEEIMLVRESNEGALQENESLRNRVQELEKQIQDIQRLLTLKSDQLAEIQTAQEIAADKMEEMKAEELAPAPVEAEAEVELEAEPEPEMAAPEMEATPPAVAEEPVVPIPPGTVIEEVDIEAQIDAAQQQEPAVTEAPMVAEPEPAPAPAAKVEAPPVKPSVAPIPPKKVSYFDGVKENSTLLSIVGGVAVLLIGLLWMIMRRRKEAEAEFAESILVSPDSGVVTTSKDDSSSLTSPTDETSFMSDFSPSDIDALQDETGEVDPLSEADVYIAYGRYQQAEELIKQAIEKTPEREELKHKLAEIYFSSKKAQEFNALAQELHQAGLEESEPETWAKIAAMGSELDPSLALFAGAAGVAAGSVVSGDDTLDDLGLDLGSEPVAEDQPAAETQDSADVEIDSMDLSGLESIDEMDSESLEANLSMDSEFLNKMESEEGAAKEEDALDIDLSDLDMDSGVEEVSHLDLTDIDQESEVSSDVTASGTADAIELEDSETLDNLDLESIERELEGLSSDLDSEEPEADDLSLLQSHSENLDLDSTDEITTKLDLARAYIDMGDVEGAKSILEEVSSEGSDTQQKEAQELLNSLGS
ncbi:MAG: FimV/HubP family polar landmark protein [Candidatus Thiodiazotropha sp.]